jgi:hypothetical protein
MTGLPILFKLLIAHFAGDFVLQSSWIVENRNKSLFNKALVYHLLIHLICILVLFLFQIDWRIVSVILVSHAAIDILKAGAEMRLNKAGSEIAPRENQWNLQRWRICVFVADQLLHLSVIIGAWLIFTGQNSYFLNFSVPDQWWLIALAYLVITTPTGIFIGKLVRRWYHQIMTGTEAATGTVTGSLGGLPQAGSWIGIIERVLTLSFILAGSFEAIGFLLAAKSILRIGDLKEDHEHKKTEYILIGTLLSFGITILLGLGLVMLLKEF